MFVWLVPDNEQAVNWIVTPAGCVADNQHGKSTWSLSSTHESSSRFESIENWRRTFTPCYNQTTSNEKFIPHSWFLKRFANSSRGGRAALGLGTDGAPLLANGSHSSLRLRSSSFPWASKTTCRWLSRGPVTGYPRRFRLRWVAWWSLSRRHSRIFFSVLFCSVIW